MYSHKSLALTPLLALAHRVVCAPSGAHPICSQDNIAYHISSINSPLSHNVTILDVVHVPFNGSYGDPTPILGVGAMYSTALPDLCAVELNVTSSETSSYSVSIFLPSNWNSRFLAVGGGGVAGYTNYADMGVGSQYGFATVSTDNGHKGAPFDVTWAYKNTEKQIDFGWRAMHGSVELAKQLITRYYGEDIRYNYYSGCSTGGRQGLKEAQVDASSFDGMLIGAPAWWTSHQVSWTTKVSKDYYPVGDPKSIPAELFSTLVAPTVIEQCDKADGLKDGIVSAPDKCHPDFDVISCDNHGANSSACLTSLQIDTLKKIYADYYVGKEFVHPGLGYSSELGWSQNMFSGQPIPFGLDWLRYAVFEDLDWPLDAYNDSTYEYIKKLDIWKDVDADDYDVSPYRNRGGKIVMYHGLSDPLIVTKGSGYFYERVEKATAASRPIHDWFRLFYIPGMMHCSGTAPGVDAPWHINGGGQNLGIGSNAYSVPGFRDPQHDALLALMEWVEGGKAVDQIIATTWHNSTVPSSGVWKQRPLCPYPKKAVYDGFGDANKAHSWVCK
ncbi:tannase and feruloyl esterase [Hypoxylon trugodes]|uniref:tannase and feruloyl esterase n=1 Tax=Hypoxylon trugodes TaxID=326681 RepID=UPI00219991C1|nr:tannase and feruloyl esterase [Hypoxylon trugodes]KAI1386112.1 tannase and feruloyl esterase [Hypoxylon trugodes]